MSKTKEELLIAYKKANKEARKRIIAKSGCVTEARYLASLLEEDVIEGSPAAAKLFKKNTIEETDALDMVICFDTTGSMSSYIGAVRAHVKELIPKLFKENTNLRMKIVAFGDYCDMTGPGNFGPAYQETSLTNDENELINFVANAKNTGGGDGDEFYELVIKKVLDETPWREGSKKAAMLIADASPHKVGYSYGSVISNNQIDWRLEAKRSADMMVQWDTFTCGYNFDFYQKLSEITNGVNLPFKTASKSQEAIYAATSVRGSLKSKREFMASYTAAMDSGDEELIGTYKRLSSKL